MATFDRIVHIETTQHYNLDAGINLDTIKINRNIKTKHCQSFQDHISVQICHQIINLLQI